MATVAARRSEDTDPLRAALRKAIGMAEETQARLADHRAAIDQARALVQASVDKHEAALAELAGAKQRYAGTIAARAGGARHSPPSGIHEARRAVEAAEDEGEAATAALKKLEAELPGFVMAHWIAQADVEARIEAMLAPVARDVLAEVQRRESELAERRAALGVMLENDLIKQAPDEIRSFNFRQQCDAVFDGELRQSIVRLLRPPLDADKAHAMEIASAWRRARETLRLDADTALPD